MSYDFLASRNPRKVVVEVEAPSANLSGEIDRDYRNDPEGKPNQQRRCPREAKPRKMEWPNKSQIETSQGSTTNSSRDSEEATDGWHNIYRVFEDLSCLVPRGRALDLSDALEFEVLICGLQMACKVKSLVGCGLEVGKMQDFVG